MTINIPCWTTSKEEADKLVDKLSEVCFEYGKDESKEKMLDVFYKTKALKNYVGIMQGRIELLTARIAELEAERRWIPVSERMPDNWKPVLTIDMSESTRVPVPAFYNPEMSLWSTHFSYDLWVTHWMPLSEPAEEEER